MNTRPVVDRAQWLGARKRLLEREKAFDRERDALTAAVRELPWVEVTEPYRFEGANGEVSFDELFRGRSQLIVQHFMFEPGWEAGCPSCSFWADGFDRLVVHLEARDTTFVAISRAPYAKLSAYRSRMGWSFPWVSSGQCTFNFDFGVSVRDADAEHGRMTYNYVEIESRGGEYPGLSVFARAEGRIYHTYSTFARGLDHFNTAYDLLDLVPKGRDEAGLRHPQAWVRRRDEY